MLSCIDLTEDIIYICSISFTHMAKTEYTTLNLPKSLVEELKVWRMAYCTAYGKQVSYSEMLRGMLDSIEKSEPDVVEELERIIEKHPDLGEKVSCHIVKQ